MCGGFKVEVLENFGTNEGTDTIDDETSEASAERDPYRDEITVSDEEVPYRDEAIVSDEEVPYRDETNGSNERDTYRNARTGSDEEVTNRDETNVLDETDSYQNETTVSGERDTYRNETTVPDEGDTYQNETSVSNEGDTYQNETSVSNEGDTYRNETTVSNESVLNQKSESSDSETPKKKRLFSILDISDYFSDSSETGDMTQYAPILFPRKETINEVTSSESSSDLDELEDVYGDIVFKVNERHEPNEKVDLLKMDPKSLPYRISTRVNKQSKFITEDNIDKDILHENLERLRGILLKTHKARLEKLELSKYLVKEEKEEYDYCNEIFCNGTAKSECSDVQLKPCYVVLERLSSDVISHNRCSQELSNTERNITKNQVAILKPCKIVLERLVISTTVAISHDRDSKKIYIIQRNRSKKQIAKSSKITAEQDRLCTRRSKKYNT